MLATFEVSQLDISALNVLYEEQKPGFQLLPSWYPFPRVPFVLANSPSKLVALLVSHDDIPPYFASADAGLSQYDNMAACSVAVPAMVASTPTCMKKTCKEAIGSGSSMDDEGRVQGNFHDGTSDRFEP